MNTFSTGCKSKFLALLLLFLAEIGFSSAPAPGLNFDRFPTFNQQCSDDAGAPWTDEMQEAASTGKRYHFNVPTVPILQADGSCAEPMKDACAQRGDTKTAYLEGPVSCGDSGWFCRILPQDGRYGLEPWGALWTLGRGDWNFNHCNTTAYGDISGHCHGSDRDDTYYWWVRDHFNRGYAGRLRCCCGWENTANVVARCDYRSPVFPQYQDTCRDANEDHDGGRPGSGFSKGFEGVIEDVEACTGFVEDSRQNTLQERPDSQCWEIHNFGFQSDATDNGANKLPCDTEEGTVCPDTIPTVNAPCSTCEGDEEGQGDSQDGQGDSQDGQESGDGNTDSQEGQGDSGDAGDNGNTDSQEDDLNASILLIGDSFSEFAQDSVGDLCAGKSDLNGGVSGTLATEWDANTIRATLGGRSYTHIIHSVGANDYLGMSCTMDESDLERVIGDSVDALRQEAPNAEIVMLGYNLPRALPNDGCGSTVAQVQSNLDTLNGAIANVAATRAGVSFVAGTDAAARSSSGLSDAKYMADQDHLNLRGYCKVLTRAEVQTALGCGPLVEVDCDSYTPGNTDGDSDDNTADSGDNTNDSGEENDSGDNTNDSGDENESGDGEEFGSGMKDPLDSDDNASTDSNDNSESFKWRFTMCCLSDDDLEQSNSALATALGIEQTNIAISLSSCDENGACEIEFDVRVPTEETPEQLSGRMDQDVANAFKTQLQSELQAGTNLQSFEAAEPSRNSTPNDPVSGGSDSNLPMLIAAVAGGFALAAGAGLIYHMRCRKSRRLSVEELETFARQSSERSFSGLPKMAV